MSDDIDRAQNEVDRSLTQAMRLRKPEGPRPTGRCLHCEEIVADTHRWCSIGCREDWEKESRRGRR